METIEESRILARLEPFIELNDEAQLARDDVEAQLTGLADQLLTARRERVTELLEKERLSERLAKLFTVLPGALLVLDADGLIIECNRAAIETMGRPLIGRTWSEVVSRIAAAGTNARGQFRLEDGRVFSVTRTALEHESAELLLITDISESQQLAELLGRQNRLAAMGEMSARLAHQVRTPLSAALLYLSQLERRSTESGRENLYVERAVQRLRDLEILINDMLIFAGGRIPMSDDFDLEDVLEDALETIAPKLEDPFQIQIVESCGALPITGHRKAVQSAIVNLLDNAVAVSDGHEPVTISVSCAQDVAILRIRDQGPGVPEEFVDRIFEPFFSTRSAGTGLGLAVVHSIADAHGGRISVNDALDGAEFVLELPLKSCPSEPLQGKLDNLAGAYV